MRFTCFKEFVFFDNFCPKYPDWVAPNPPHASGDATKQTGYLKETWDKKTSLHKVHFRFVDFGEFTRKQDIYKSKFSDNSASNHHKLTMPQVLHPQVQTVFTITALSKSATKTRKQPAQRHG